MTSRTLERGALVAEARKRGDVDVPPDALAGQGIWMQAVGWIPPGYDHEQGTAEMLEAQLAGFYDPDSKSMFLAADLPASEAEATLAHELVHALQDQHYNLGPRLKYRAESGDTPVALLSLAEGDATSAMIDAVMPGGLEATSLPEEHMLGMMEAQILGSARTVPTTLKASLVAPYLDGVRFVHTLRRRGGWAEVDRIWKNPPATTEQLLHIAKYDAQEPALAVPLADAVAPPSGDYRVTFTDAMGEQGLRITFEELTSTDEARAAAAGWGGDRTTVLTRTGPDGEEHFVTWWLRFDQGDRQCSDAGEAFRVLRRGILPQGNGTAAGLLCRERPEMGPLAVIRSGCDVLVTAGPFVKAGAKWRSSGGCDGVRQWVPKAFEQAARTPGKRVGE
ncbi:MAG: hypothetical protein EOO75_08535 [Myxococcales bacterium]|nr:MAG: hypothetical protein EOO75_08535 [Myxococcales bacterium]